MHNIQNIMGESSKLKLLYVEDDELARSSTIPILQEFFKSVVVAVDGRDGLKKYNKENFDLIITDINMPYMNGLEMIEEIRKNNADISVLVLSAYNETEFFIDSIRLDIEGYLFKPIDLEQFLNVIKKVTNKINLQNEAIKGIHLLNQYQQLADKNSIVSKMDKEGVLTYVNDEYCKISGYLANELVGRHFSFGIYNEGEKNLANEIWDTIKHKKQLWHGIVREHRKNKDTYYTKSAIKPILNRAGEIIEFMGIHYDISDIMNPKKQLQDFVDSSDENIVLIVKIEGFENIEKYYGHIISQKIEDLFTTKLMELIPKNCKFEKVYALGDGEYAFAKDKTSCTFSEETIAFELKQFQQDVDDIHINIDDIEYDISVIISFASGKEALNNAKYGLKELLRTNQDFIQATDLIENERKTAQENIKTIKMIKKAIDESKVVSYFQPIVNNNTQKIEKYESLVRIIDAHNNVIEPCLFLDISKKGKYYTKITNIVLENSFGALKNTDKEISINLSALDIEKSATRQSIYILVERYKQDAHRIIFELLEDENIKDFELIKRFITKIKRYGVQIAIDDFGSGYSNFSRILEYQPDILKIDGSLVKNIQNDDYSLSVVKTIIAFAESQNIKVVAEFVENRQIYDILHSLGVAYSQGYYFGRPNEL